MLCEATFESARVCARHTYVAAMAAQKAAAAAGAAAAAAVMEAVRQEAQMKDSVAAAASRRSPQRLNALMAQSAHRHSSPTQAAAAIPKPQPRPWTTDTRVVRSPEREPAHSAGTGLSDLAGGIRSLRQGTPDGWQLTGSGLGRPLTSNSGLGMNRGRSASLSARKDADAWHAGELLRQPSRQPSRKPSRKPSMAGYGVAWPAPHAANAKDNPAARGLQLAGSAGSARRTEARVRTEVQTATGAIRALLKNRRECSQPESTGSVPVAAGSQRRRRTDQAVTEVAIDWSRGWAGAADRSLWLKAAAGQTARPSNGQQQRGLDRERPATSPTRRLVVLQPIGVVAPRPGTAEFVAAAASVMAAQSAASPARAERLKSAGQRQPLRSAMPAPLLPARHGLHEDAVHHPRPEAQPPLRPDHGGNRGWWEQVHNTAFGEHPLALLPPQSPPSPRVRATMLPGEARLLWSGRPRTTGGSSGRAGRHQAQERPSTSAAGARAGAPAARAASPGVDLGIAGPKFEGLQYTWPPPVPRTRTAAR